MLSEQEIEYIRTAASRAENEHVKWIAQRLEEVNTEASRYSQELYKLNEELIALVQRYEG